MSAAGQIKELVESLVGTLTGEHERRIAALEAEVEELKKGAPATHAQTGTASAKAKASPARTRTTSG